MNNDQEQWARANEEELWLQQQREQKEVKVKINWKKVFKQAMPVKKAKT